MHFKGANRGIIYDIPTPFFALGMSISGDEGVSEIVRTVMWTGGS